MMSILSDFIQRNPNAFDVILGLHDQRQDETGFILEVERIFVHPGYNKEFNTFPNDIALLIFDHNVAFDSNIQSISLPTRPAAPKTRCVVAGWGCLFCKTSIY